MPEVSLRLVEAATERLDAHCAAHGLRRRGALEGLLECFLTVDENPTTEAECRLHDAVWNRARHLDELAAGGGMKDQRSAKVNIDLDEELHAWLKAACQRHGVSINGLVAAGLTPIDSWGGPEEDAAMADCMERAVVAARRRDYARNLGKPVPPADCCPQHPVQGGLTGS